VSASGATAVTPAKLALLRAQGGLSTASDSATRAAALAATAAAGHSGSASDEHRDTTRGPVHTGNATPSGSTSGSTTPAPTTPQTDGTGPTTSAPGSSATTGQTASLPPAGSPAATTAASSTPPAQFATPTSVHITANIPASPANNSACASAPTGAACTNAGIAALNHARSVLGLAPYAIPAGFASMTVANQLLTLSNLDRVLYGLKPIAGINATLNTAAQLGVTNGGDPSGVNVGAAQWTGWASNWASGYPSAVFTYYAWMYEDGPGSPNISCTTTNTAGCWGHRLNTLHDFGAGAQVAMGVGTGGSGGKDYTELYESFAATAAIPYS
jgi:hypothetical protein